MGNQSMGSDVSAQVVVHHVFRILVSNDTNQNNSNGAPSKVSMAIIITVLIGAFLFMGFFSIYVRRCTRSDDSANTASQQAARNAAAYIPVQGLDKAIIDTLPLVGYSLVKGLKGGKDLSECSVCLTDFEDDDNLRLLPKCGHVFHPECIDMWFFTHATCPLCRASLLPAEGKEGVVEEMGFSHDFRNWVVSRGTGPNGEQFTIHEGPPVPPNGSLLELLSRDGADRILAESLRRSERLDAGLARREEEDENTERAAGIRALNRSLSKNSSSFRNASRGLDASGRIDAVNSALFNSSSVVINMDVEDDAGGTGRGATKSRSVGSSHSFNLGLLRSSSVGSSGRYLRQYFGAQDDSEGFRLRLLGSAHKLPVVNPNMRRERSASELSNLEVPAWEEVDLNGEAVTGGQGVPPTITVSGALPFERWTSRGRKFFSAELPSPGAKGIDLPSGEPSGPLYTLRKERAPQVEERTKSERWNFGQSLRRTFSLRRTSSYASDVGTSSQQNSAVSKSKKLSAWAGAMKIRSMSSAGADGPPSPHSHSAVDFSESLPIDSFPQSLLVDSFSLSLPVESEKDHSAPKEDPVTIVARS